MNQDLPIGLRCPHELVPSVTAIERLLSYGCGCVEIKPSFLSESGYPLKEAESILVHHVQHAGLQVVSWAMDTELLVDSEQVEENVDRFLSVVQQVARVQQQMKSSRSPAVVVRSGSISEYPQLDEVAAWRQLVRTTRRLAAAAAGLGLRLAVLPKRADLIDTAAKTRRLLDDVSCETMGVCLDPAYIYWTDDDLSEMFSTLQESILVVRLKDVVLVKEGMWLKGYRPFGKGQMNAEQCVEQIRDCPQCAGIVLDCVDSSLEVRDTVALVKRYLSAVHKPSVTLRPATSTVAELHPRESEPGTAESTTRSPAEERVPPSVPFRYRPPKPAPTGTITPVPVKSVGLRAASRTPPVDPTDDSSPSNAARPQKRSSGG